MSVRFMRSATPFCCGVYATVSWVLDAMVRQVLLEVVGQVFASVVSAQHLIFSEPEQSCTDEAADV